MSSKLILAVLGHPIQHSLSPAIHRLFAAHYNIELDYRAIDVAPNDFASFIPHFFAQAHGANVTVPFKEQAAAAVQQLSKQAQLAGAVNTIKKQADGSLFGDNTDGIGLLHDLEHNLNFTLHDKTVVLLGAGGAARGVLAPLLNAAPRRLYLVNRTQAKAEQLAQKFNHYANISVAPLTEFNVGVDLIINATSASLAAQLPALPPAAIVPQHTCCYDMLYGKKTTVFNAWAAKLGARQTWDGFGMLVEQAAAAFDIWTGVRPQTDILLPQLRSLIV